MSVDLNTVVSLHLPAEFSIFIQEKPVTVGEFKLLIHVLDDLLCEPLITYYQANL